MLYVISCICVISIVYNFIFAAVNTVEAAAIAYSPDKKKKNL